MPIPNYYRYGDVKEFEPLFLAGKETVIIKKNTILKNYSTVAKKYYYIKKGLVKVKICHVNGYEKIVCITGAGCIEPFFSFEDYAVWQGSILCEAYMNIEVVEFTRKELERLIISDPALLRRMYDCAIKRIYSSQFDTLRVLYDEGMKRVCDFIYYHVNDYKVSHNHRREQMVITQNDIASFVGLDRVNVNRIMQQLKNEGAIEIGRRYIYVKDLEKIMEYCSEDIAIGE